MKLALSISALAATLALAACGGPSQTSVSTANDCLKGKGFKVTETNQAGQGLGTALTVPLPEQNSATLYVLGSDDDAKGKISQVKASVAPDGQATQNGNVIVAYQQPPPAQQKSEISDCL